MTLSGDPRIAFPAIRVGRPAVAEPRVRAPAVLGMPAGGARGAETIAGLPRPGVDGDPDRFGDRPGKREAIGGVPRPAIDDDPDRFGERPEKGETLAGLPRPAIDRDPDRFGERPGKRAKREPVEKPQ